MEQFLTQKIPNFVAFFTQVLARATNRKYAKERKTQLSWLKSHPALTVPILGATLRKYDGTLDDYLNTESQLMGVTLTQEERDRFKAYFNMLMDVSQVIEGQKPTPPPAPVDIRTIAFEDI